MSIDARVSGIQLTSDREARLVLEPRNNRVHAGQSIMTVDNPPSDSRDLHVLIGCEVWGSDTALMCGDTLIADRTSYTSIRLVGYWQNVCSQWHKGIKT